jgi:hypothetical protein
MSRDQVPSSDDGGLEFDPVDGGRTSKLMPVNIDVETVKANQDAAPGAAPRVDVATDAEPAPPQARRFPIGWLLLAIVVGGVLYAGISWWNKGQAVSRRLAELERERVAEENLVPLAGKHPLDPVIEFAQESLDRFQQQVIDYTGTMVKRERIEGELFPRTTMFVKIRNPLEREGEARVPLSVYIRFDDPVGQKGREVIWVDGENEGNIIVHEAGLLGFKRLSLKPTGILAMLGNRYPITEMGIERLLRKMIARANRDQQHGNCEVQLSRDVPLEESRGVRVVRIVITHPERSEDHDFFRAEVELDASNFSYLRYASYDWPPKAGQPAPLLEEYIYQDVKLNPGLADDAFDPDNPEYNYP